jgi:replicative DNA helicase
MERIGNVPLSVGLKTLAEMMESAWVSVHVDYYCRKLKEFSAADDARQIGKHLAEEVVLDPGVIDDYVTRLTELKNENAQDIQSANEAVESLIEQRKSPRAIHSTGLATLDLRLNGGFRDGQLVVIGGRPGAGKSVLLSQCCLAESDRGNGALIVSLEMTKEELIDRINRHRDISDIRNAPLYLVDSTSDLTSIVALIKQAVRRYSIGLIALDYLQLCEVQHGRQDNRERQIATVSRRLKRLALDLRKPILVGSQLNRESTKRGKPTLADLRESGAIEQDADVVILLSNGDDGPDTTVDIAKHRGGARSEIQMRLDGPRFRFEDGTEEIFTGDL